MLVAMAICFNIAVHCISMVAVTVMAIARQRDQNSRYKRTNKFIKLIMEMEMWLMCIICTLSLPSNGTVAAAAAVQTAMGECIGLPISWNTQ